MDEIFYEPRFGLPPEYYDMIIPNHWYLDKPLQVYYYFLSSGQYLKPSVTEDNVLHYFLQGRCDITKQIEHNKG